jgi:hypothetical protein
MSFPLHPVYHISPFPFSSLSFPGWRRHKLLSQIPSITHIFSPFVRYRMLQLLEWKVDLREHKGDVKMVDTFAGAKSDARKTPHKYLLYRPTVSELLMKMPAFVAVFLFLCVSRQRLALGMDAQTARHVHALNILACGRPNAAAPLGGSAALRFAPAMAARNTALTPPPLSLSASLSLSLSLPLSVCAAAASKTDWSL